MSADYVPFLAVVVLLAAPVMAPATAARAAIVIATPALARTVAAAVVIVIAPALAALVIGTSSAARSGLTAPALETQQHSMINRRS